MRSFLLFILMFAGISQMKAMELICPVILNTEQT